MAQRIELKPTSVPGIYKREGMRGVSYVVRLDGREDPVTGKRRQEHKSFKRMEDAKKWRNARLTEIERGTAVDANKMTVRELFERWLPVAKRGGRLRETTVAGYEWQIAKYILPALGNAPIQRMTTETVQEFYATLASTPNIARKCHLRLSRAFDFARKQRWIVANPCDDADAPSAKAKTKEVWTEAEAERFLAVAHDGYDPLWLLALATGMRRGELLGLRWRDVDWAGNALHVRQQIVCCRGKAAVQEVKTRAGVRTVDVRPAVMAKLREHRERQDAVRAGWGTGWDDNDLVIAGEKGRPLDPNNVGRNFRALLRREEERRVARGGTDRPLTPITFHGMRHTHASILLMKRVPITVVAQRLGHASPAVTMETYAHFLPGSQGQALDALATLFG